MGSDSLMNVSSYPQHPAMVNAGLIVASLLTFILTAIFNGLAGSGAGVGSIFYSTVGDISDLFELYITPAGFTFSIWTVIYLWLAVSLVVMVITIFVSNSVGRVYLSPPIMSPFVTATFSINMILNLAWIFIWDRASVDGWHGLTILSFVVLVLIAVTNILTMVMMARNLALHATAFTRGAPDYWWGVFYRLLLNGLGVYTTWTVIASLVNLTTALVYPGGVDQRGACLASLSLLVIFHTTWFVLENFVFDKYTRYLLTPYLVVIWASNGIRAKKMTDPTVPEDVKNFVLAILIIASLTFVARIAIVIYRVLRKPLTKISTVTSFNSSQ